MRKVGNCLGKILRNLQVVLSLHILYVESPNSKSWFGDKRPNDLFEKYF